MLEVHAQQVHNVPVHFRLAVDVALARKIVVRGADISLSAAASGMKWRSLAQCSEQQVLSGGREGRDAWNEEQTGMMINAWKKLLMASKSHHKISSSVSNTTNSSIQQLKSHADSL